MAKNNEAKIKFSAETGSFNESIKKANSELSELRAELKLNETQMKTTGTSVEGLENKQKNLIQQLNASIDKTEALSEKVDKAVEIYGENSEEVKKLRTQLASALTAEEKLKQAINACTDEIKAQKTANAEAERATSKLSAEIKQQESDLSRLKREYADYVVEGKDATREAQNLAREIEELSRELKQNKDAMDDASAKADKLDKSFEKAGDSADNVSGGGMTALNVALGDLASEAIQMCIEKITEFVSYLAELPSATMELRQDLSTLTTSFDNMGFSTATAKDTWKDLYAVFGEDDRAVEASNLIAKMSTSQKDLNDWVTITTGVWGAYQDSLPVEGLAEASMETAKTGTVTGNLADALNWSSEASKMFAKYMGGDVVTAEDAFNVALSECTTEQERQALITDTLMALYGDSAETYKETAEQQMEAKEATADYTLAEAELAETIEPVTTAFTELKTELLEALTPAIETVTDLMLDALEWAKAHPDAILAIAGAVGVFAGGITALGVALGIYAIYQAIATAVAMPFLLPILAIIAGIAGLVAIIIIVIRKWDEISVAIQNAISKITSAISGVWERIKTIVSAIIDVVQVGIMFIGSIIQAGIDLITLPFRFIWENCKDTVMTVWNAIKRFISNAINAVKNVITPVMNAIKNVMSNVWNGIKNAVVTAWNGIKNFITPVINGIRNTISSVFNGIKSTASNIWNGIKNAIVKPIESAKDRIKSIIDTIKGFFSNLKLSLPNIKMPHFKISGKFSLNPPSVPKLKIDWYKEGGIMMKPTIFGMNGNSLMAGGEAGPEAILPIDKLEGYVAGAIEKTIKTANMNGLVSAIEELADRAIELKINGRHFATATASDGDAVNGLRSTFKNRGLVLD